MKTHDLINALAADHGTPQPSLPMRLMLGALVGAGLSAVFLLALGVRPDIAAALATWQVALKFLVVGSLAATGALLISRLAKPIAPGGKAWRIMLVAPLLLAAACLYELAAMPPDAWLRLALGVNAAACLVSIPLLAALPLAGTLWALRASAPASPKMAGAVAGAMAAGVGAAIYALHCTDDSPLFLAAWYPLATALVVAAGTASGARSLRW